MKNKAQKQQQLIQAIDEYQKAVGREEYKLNHQYTLNQLIMVMECLGLEEQMGNILNPPS